MKHFKAITALLLTSAILASCTHHMAADKDPGRLACDLDFDHPLPGNVFVNRDAEDPIISGIDYEGVLVDDQWITQAVCDIDHVSSLLKPDVKAYIFEYDDRYEWDTEDVLEICEGEFQASSAGDHLAFTIHFPDNDAQYYDEADWYSIVFVKDGEVECVKDVVVGHACGVTCPNYRQYTEPEWTDFPPDVDKPVIYLYPEEETDINITLDFNGDLTCTYPAYDPVSGWTVTASPDGNIYDHGTGRNYDYLFWEGQSPEVPCSFDHAACVAGEDTAAFLESYLTACGLNDSEIDDFISFWLPDMEGNAYNLISFPTEEYEQMAQLNVSPAPDTVIRVYMVFTPLDAPVQIEDGHELIFPEGVSRDGYTLVEWGGSQI